MYVQFPGVTICIYIYENGLKICNGTGVWFVVQLRSCERTSHGNMGWVIWLHCIERPLTSSWLALFIPASLWSTPTHLRPLPLLSGEGQIQKKADTYPKHTLCRHSVPAPTPPHHPCCCQLRRRCCDFMSSTSILLNSSNATAWMESAIEIETEFVMWTFQAAEHQSLWQGWSQPLISMSTFLI